MFRLFTCLLAALALPLTASADLRFTLAEPDTVYASNVVVDIIEFNGGVWMITPDGVNFTFDDGQSWLLYNDNNGLVSDNMSAIFHMNGRLWVASNGVQNFGGENFDVSDGVSYTDDEGNTWINVDFSPSGQDIPVVVGVDRTVFDITGHSQPAYGNDWLFFTAFAGGMLASQDNGATWRRIHANRTDSVNFYQFYCDQYGITCPSPRVGLNLTNRYFSAKVDTSHGDTLILWAGSAGGLYEYTFAPVDQKPNSNFINTITVGCAVCDGTDTTFVFLGGNNGISRGTTAGDPYVARFVSDGLPGAFITASELFAGRLWVGTATDSLGPSTGIAYADDPFGALTFTADPFADFIGANVLITDMASINNRLYVAAREMGLYVTADTGTTWQHIIVDSANTAPGNGRNVVNALAAVIDTSAAAGDTLWIGTDSGVVGLFMDDAGNFVDANSYKVAFPENANYSSRVRRIRVQDFITVDSIGGSSTLDSQSIWTVNQPTSQTGTYMVARSVGVNRQESVVAWNFFRRDQISNDVGFNGDSAIIVGKSEIGQPSAVFTTDGLPFLANMGISDGPVSLNNRVINAIGTAGDTLWFGSDSGFAFTMDGGDNFEIRFANPDSLVPDVAPNVAATNSRFTSTFLPAVAVQYQSDRPARVWVSNHPAGRKTSATTSGAGMTVGLQFPVVDIDDPADTLRFERVWALANDSLFAWNYGFNGDTVFAATDSGLLMADQFDFDTLGNLLVNWQKIEIEDANGEEILLPGTPILAATVIDTFLWVGTEDRTIRFSLADVGSGPATTFYVIDSTEEIYAFPVPYSHFNNAQVQFHFRLDQDADVTIEIYDFAMNLVSRPVDNVRLFAGVYPGPSVNDRVTWDGRNGRGDDVAVGMYYFKLTTSTGIEQWGKIAVIP